MLREGLLIFGIIAAVLVQSGSANPSNRLGSAASSCLFPSDDTVYQVPHTQVGRAATDGEKSGQTPRHRLAFGTSSSVQTSTCLDYDTLLAGTLESTLSFLDPLTGLLYDNRQPSLDHGNREKEAGGIVPDLPDARFDDKNNLTAEVISGEPGLTLDYGLRLRYTRGSGFGYVAIPAGLNLDVPRITGIKLRGRAWQRAAPLEVKLECTDGRQLIWNAEFRTDRYDWLDLPLPSPALCDLTRVDKLTFVAVDAKLTATSAEYVWDIDHVAFAVDASEIGRVHIGPEKPCEGPYQPLPCRSSTTSVDNVGYGLAALGVVACLALPIDVPGFPTAEEAIVRALETLERWPKWSGQAPSTAWLTYSGFTWTWFSPTTGLPPPNARQVFALDHAHLSAALRVLEQAANWQACRLDPRFEEAIRVKARALRVGMDWRLLVRNGDLALEWTPTCNSDQTGLCGREVARGNEAILRIVESVVSGAVPSAYFDKLSCELTDGAGGYAWYKTFNEQPGQDPTRCSATFVQQAPFIFLDPSKLPKSPRLRVRDPVDSLRQLLRAHGLDQPGLHGWSDSLLPDGSGYVTACQIPASVVTPQAAVLGLGFLREAEEMVCKFHQAGVDRPYRLGAIATYRGMRDSYDTATRSVGDAVFLALDQARNALALLNFLYPTFGGTGLPVVRALFARDPDVSTAYESLSNVTVCD